MEIYRLYELVKMWEVALTLTKPNDIQKIRVKPIIDNDIECYGEGKVWGSIELTLEKEGVQKQFSIIDIFKEYKTIEEGEEAEETMVFVLIDYLEQFLDDANIQLIWNQIKELNLNWHEEPPS